jgi:hypothetical protein
LLSFTHRSGRAVAPIFEKLPSKSSNPDYYKKVRLPLSLELLEKKLKNYEYPNLSALESDFKRLVQNAKEINARTSEAFNDAERIRKAVSNLMVKTNPAYKSGNYQAVPTPLPPSPGRNVPDDDDDEDDAPGEEDNGDLVDPDVEADADGDGNEDEEVEEEPEPVKRGRRSGRPSRGAAVSTPKASRSSSAQVVEQDGFKGLTFQQAQEKIVTDMLQKKDERYARCAISSIAALFLTNLEQWRVSIFRSLLFSSSPKPERLLRNHNRTAFVEGSSEASAWPAW